MQIINEGEVIELLYSAGLNWTQIRMYLSLIGVVEAPVKTISKLSGVDKAEIYRKMPSLLKLGLVEKIIGLPVKFRAIPLKSGLNLLLKRENAKHNQLKIKIEEIKNKIPDIQRKNFEHEEQFIIIPGKRPHVEWLKNKYNDLEESTQGIVAWEDDKAIQLSCTNELEKADNRGVKARVILYVPKGEEKKCMNYLKGQKRFINTEKRIISIFPQVFGGTFDQKEIVIGTSRKNPIQNAETVFWSSNPSIIFLFKKYFEDLWKKSRSICFKRE